MVVVVALLSQLVVASDAFAQSTPTIGSVEIRPDGRVQVSWSAVSGATSYDLAVSTDGGGFSELYVVPPVSGPVVRRILEPGTDWDPTPGADYLIVVRANGLDSPAATVHFERTQPAITQTSGTASAVSLSWQGVSATESFVRYEVYIARENDSLASCKVAELTNRAAVSFTISSLAPGCGSGPLSAGTAYTVGVRTVSSNAPVVHTALSAATATTAGGAPLPPEKFQVAQSGGQWAIVDQFGAPAVWNGINVRRGDGASFTNSLADVVAIEAQGFDTIRLVMAWNRFEQAEGVFDHSSFAAVDLAISRAANAGIDVVLDPIHITDDGTWGMPSWAWQQSNDGFVDSRVMLDVLRENSAGYLQYVAQRYRNAPNVVALDLLNEPREPLPGDLAARNVQLMSLYHDMIAQVRDIDPDKPLVLQPFYGSTPVTAQQLAGVRNATVADPTPVTAEFDNLVWSFHDYYAGFEGSASDDGYSRSGYPLDGTAADGTLLRSDDYELTSCYPSGPSATNCTNLASRELLLRPSMLRHINRHFDAAQAAEMPLYIGEFGVPHPGGGRPGWAGGAEMLADKVLLYDQLGIGRSVWAWRDDVDETFGLFDEDDGTWHPWTQFAAGRSPSGDVNCDGLVNVGDALLVAQFTVGNRTTHATCPLADLTTQIFTPEANVNCDDRINSADALFIAQYVVGNRTAHPTCPLPNPETQIQLTPG